MVDKGTIAFFGVAVALCGLVLGVAGALTLAYNPPVDSFDLLRVRAQVAFSAALVLGGLGAAVWARR